MSHGDLTLGEIVGLTGGVIQTGPFGSQLHARDYQSMGTPVVMPTNLGDNVIREERIARIGDHDVRRLARHQLREGDVIFSRRGDVGRRAIVRAENSGWLCGTGCLAVKFGPRRADVNPIYVSLLIGTPKVQTWLVDNAVGGTMLNLNTSILSSLPLHLPSRHDQDAAVEALEGVFAQESSLKRLIAKKRDIKQGLMQELLSGRTRLPGFTGGWRALHLGDHVTYVRSVPLSRDQLDRTSPLKYLHYGDIHTTSAVRLDAAVENMPRASAVLAGRAGRLAPGDVVFADASEDAAGVGKSVEITSVPVEGVVPGLHTIAARFNKAVLADGFKAYLQFIPSFRESLLRLAAGTKVLATTRSYVSSIDLLLPGPGEQRAIASVLADVGNEITALDRRLESARNIKQGMMQELLTGRTRLVSGVAA